MYLLFENANKDLLFTVIYKHMLGNKDPISKYEENVEYTGAHAGFLIIGLKYFFVPLIILKVKQNEDLFMTFSKL